MKSKILLFLFCFFLITIPVKADEYDISDEWQFKFTPMFGWALGLDGETSVAGKSASVDISTSEIVDDLEMMITGHFEAKKKRYGIIVDYEYLEVGGSTTTSSGNVHVKLSQSILETLAFARQKVAEDMYIDVLLGSRYWDINAKATDSIYIKKEIRWLDPLVGLRYFWKFDDEWVWEIRTDYAGFGLGSDYSINFQTTLEYMPWENVSIVFGTRLMDTYYKKDSFKYDMAITGPIVGFSFRW